MGLILGAFNYQIEYRKGADNSNADALSRYPVMKQIAENDVSECCYINEESALSIETIPFFNFKC